MAAEQRAGLALVVTVVAADGNELKVLSRNEVGEDIVATPSIDGNAIFVRTLRNLYSFQN